MSEAPWARSRHFWNTSKALCVWTANPCANAQAFEPIGGLVVNWVVMGSGHKTRPKEGVLQVKASEPCTEQHCNVDQLDKLDALLPRCIVPYQTRLVMQSRRCTHRAASNAATSPDFAVPKVCSAFLPHTYCCATTCRHTQSACRLSTPTACT